MTDTPDYTDVEVWAPQFLYYGGDRSKPKFTKEQILAEAFAVMNGYCKLCDRPITGTTKAHLAQHRKELTAFLAKRRKQAEAAKAAGRKKGTKARQQKAAHDEAADILKSLAEGGGDDE